MQDFSVEGKAWYGNIERLKSGSFDVRCMPVT